MPREAIADHGPVEQLLVVAANRDEVDELPDPDETDGAAAILDLGVQHVVNDLMVGRKNTESEIPRGRRQGGIRGLLRWQYVALSADIPMQVDGRDCTGTIQLGKVCLKPVGSGRVSDAAEYRPHAVVLRSENEDVEVAQHACSRIRVAAGNEIDGTFEQNRLDAILIQVPNDFLELACHAIVTHPIYRVRAPEKLG